MKKKYEYCRGFEPSLLPTESEDDFYSLYSRLKQQLKPLNPLQELELHSAAVAAWERQRIRRCKTVTLKLRYAKAIPLLFEKVGLGTVQSATPLAKEWLETDAGKAKVKEHLGRVGLDESAIEAVVLEQSKEMYSNMDKLEATAENRWYHSLDSFIGLTKAFPDRVPQETDRAENDETDAAPSANEDTDAA